jgi:hypothetical protein
VAKGANLPFPRAFLFPVGVIAIEVKACLAVRHGLDLPLSILNGSLCALLVFLLLVFPLKSFILLLRLIVHFLFLPSPFLSATLLLGPFLFLPLPAPFVFALLFGIPAAIKISLVSFPVAMPVVIETGMVAVTSILLPFVVGLIA